MTFFANFVLQKLQYSNGVFNFCKTRAVNETKFMGRERCFWVKNVKNAKFEIRGGIMQIADPCAKNGDADPFAEIGKKWKNRNFQILFAGGNFEF